jgi:hypothetical protein
MGVDYRMPARGGLEISVKGCRWVLRGDFNNEKREKKKLNAEIAEESRGRRDVGGYDASAL